MRKKFIDNLIKLKAKKNLENTIVQHVTHITEGKPGKPGKDGDNYVLTKKDKLEIASMIIPPVVDKIIEKTETIHEIKEVPIVTNEIVEVAMRDTGKEIIEKINDLKIEPELQIDKEHIKGLEEYDEVVKRSGRQGSDLGTVVTLEGLIYVNGSKTDAKQINIIAGSGISITYNNLRGRGDITISSSSVGGLVLQATGTVNGTNTIFTFTQKPSLIVTDGVAYQETNKIGETIWTWVAGTLTATLTIPPQSDIYGIS